VARAGLALGVLGLANPLVGLIALTCSLIGLQRVDPHARPPIERKRQAIAGIVLGVVSVLIWGTFFMLKGQELVDYLTKG
jgi:Na+/proline symporter